jgi:hypothetical protein
VCLIETPTLYLIIIVVVFVTLNDDDNEKRRYNLSKVCVLLLFCFGASLSPELIFCHAVA